MLFKKIVINNKKVINIYSLIYKVKTTKDDNNKDVFGKNKSKNN